MMKVDMNTFLYGVKKKDRVEIYSSLVIQLETCF